MLAPGLVLPGSAPDAVHVAAALARIIPWGRKWMVSTYFPSGGVRLLERAATAVSGFVLLCMPCPVLSSDPGR